MSRILLHGGRLLDPSADRDARFDLLIEAGRIAAVGPNPATLDEHPTADQQHRRNAVQRSVDCRKEGKVQAMPLETPSEIPSEIPSKERSRGPSTPEAPPASRHLKESRPQQQLRGARNARRLEQPLPSAGRRKGP